MIHTLELNCQLTNKGYNELVQDLIKYCKKKNKKFYKKDEFHKKSNNKTTYIGYSNLLEHHGIQIYFVHSISMYSYYGMKLILNPTRMIYKDNYLDLLTEKDIKKFIHLFNKYVQKISFDFPQLGEFNVSRIDFCKNFNFAYYEEMDKYLKLLKRGDVPSNFNIWKEYNNISHRKVPPKNSVRLENDSVGISVYSKEEQLRNEFKNCCDLKRSKGILRFEIQCKKKKINEIKKVYDFDNKRIYKFLSEVLSREILCKYFQKCFGQGDYYTLKEVINKIEESHSNKNKRERMIDIVKGINKSRGVCNYRKTINYRIRKFNDTLKDIDNLGINVVTIPKKWGIDYLPNPKKLLFDDKAYKPVRKMKIIRI
jgi:hypothetical protein